MAINNNTRFLGIDSTKVNLIEKKDSVNNSIAEYFTAEEIASNSLEIIADGSIGGPGNIEHIVAASYPSGTIGEQSLIIRPLADINLSPNGNPFTASSIVFPKLENAWGVGFQSFSSIINLEFPNLISARQISIGNLSFLSSLNLNSLVSCSSVLNLGNLPSLQLNLPSLREANLQLNNLSGFPTTLDSSVLPVIETLGLNCFDQSVTNISLPTVITLTQLSIGSRNITTINLPNIVNFNLNFVGITNRPITTLILGGVGITKSWGSINRNPYIDLQSNALDQSSVDNILLTLASLDGTNGTTIVNTGTLLLNGGINQPPSQAGLNALQVLLSRGWGVSTN